MNDKETNEIHVSGNALRRARRGITRPEGRPAKFIESLGSMSLPDGKLRSVCFPF